MAGRFGSFIVGGVIGAVAALLYAPRTGEETRAYVADKANEAWGNAQNYGNDASARGQELYGNAKAKGQEVYQSATEAASAAYTRATAAAQDVFNAATDRVQEVAGNAKPFATTQNDELREKIEAARARIASQVAKNAEAAKETPGQVEVEAVVEAVEDAAETAQ